MRALGQAAAWLCVLWLFGCAPAVPPPVERPAPPALDEQSYRAAAARGEAVYRLESDRSLVVVRVYRGGPLARFGHDHVIATRTVTGFAWLARDAAQRRADFYIPLDTLSVDEPALRAAVGFDSTPSAQDIAGTRRNMLEQVLHAERHPYAVLRVIPAGGEATSPQFHVEMTLRGVTRTISLPVALDTPGNALRATGSFTMRQTDFGITPFSVLGGALRVEDRLDLHFELVGSRLGG